MTIKKFRWLLPLGIIACLFLGGGFGFAQTGSDPLGAHVTGKAKLSSDDELIVAKIGYLTPLMVMDGDGSGLSSYPFNAENGDRIACGDLDGDGREEIIRGKAANGRIVITDMYASAVLASFAADFKPEDGLATGDINGDGKDEIIHGAQWIAQNEGTPFENVVYPGQIRIYRVLDFSGHHSQWEIISRIWIDTYDMLLKPGNGLAAGDVDGNGVEEIVHGNSHDDCIHVFDLSGRVNTPFDVDFQTYDGLAVGDINGDFVADIVHCDRGANRIQAFDLSGNLLTVCSSAGEGGCLEESDFRFDWSFQEHDGIAVADVDGDLIGEIIHADRSRDAIRYLEVVESSNGTQGVGQIKHDVTIDFDDGDMLAVGDVDGDSIWVGLPLVSTETIENQVIGTINAPPKHNGVNFEPDQFYATYENRQSTETSQTIYAKNSWAMTESLAVSIDALSLASFHFGYERKHGKAFESTYGNLYKKSFGDLLESDLQDSLIKVDTTYRLYEYPILSPPKFARTTNNDASRQQQYFLIRVPLGAPENITLSSVFEPEDHVYGNIRSYPESLDELPNFHDANEIHRVTLENLGSDQRDGWCCWAEIENKEEKKTSFIESSWTLGTSSGFNIGGFSVNYSASLEGEYGSQQAVTHQLKSSEETCIHVRYEGGIDELEKSYNVQSVWYYDAEDGHIVLDHIVPWKGEYYDALVMDFTQTPQLLQGIEAGLIEGITPTGFFPQDATTYAQALGLPFVFMEKQKLVTGVQTAVPISVVNAECLGKIEGKIRYDPSLIRIAGRQLGSVTSKSVLHTEKDKGEFRFQITDSGCISGHGFLINLDIQALEMVQQKTVFDIQVNATRLGEKQPFPLPVRNGLLIITGQDTDFSATVREGPAPLTVNFQDTSLNQNDLWKWDFGNGRTSTVENPSCTYYQPGKYTVGLKSSAQGHTDIEVKKSYIHVSAPTDPDADDDGLPDDWEISFFGDIETTNGRSDRDGDGLNEFQEYRLGLSPLQSSCLYSKTELLEALDQAKQKERGKWDVDLDGKMGLGEAIRALQVLSGRTGL